MKTWDNIRRRALFDVYLHRMMTLIDIGTVSREQALIETVLALSHERQALMDAEVFRRSHQTRIACQHQKRRTYNPKSNLGDESDYCSQCAECGAVLREEANA